MNFWLSLIHVDVREFVEVASLAEELGFTGVVLPDHVCLPEQPEAQYPYAEVTLGLDAPYPDPVVGIAAMAAVTSTLRFTSYVYVVPMRDPFSVAKSFATAAILSGNRVALGAGVGWLFDEFALLDRDFASRGARMDEMLDIITALWRDGVAEYHGKYFEFGRAHMQPQPEQPPPVWIGGYSDAAFRRAARHDGWLGLNDEPEALEHHLNRLDAARDAEGRRSAAFEVMVSPAAPPSVNFFRSLQERGVTSILTPPLAVLTGDARSPVERRDGLARYIDDFVRPLAP